MPRTAKRRVFNAVTALVIAVGLVVVAVFFVHNHQASVANFPDPVKEQQASSAAQSFDNQPALAYPVTTARAAPVYSTLTAGQVFATLSIPKIGVNYPVGEGIDLTLLATSIGHYSGTALPGQDGNFATAGHDCCREHGSPYALIHELVTGDQILVTTRTDVYTYLVVPMPACGLDVPQIVDLHQVSVLNSAPCEASGPVRKLLTLTTCTPRVDPSVPPETRVIVFAELAQDHIRA